MGLPSFPSAKRSKRTKEIERQIEHDVSNEKRVHSFKSVMVSLSLNSAEAAAVGEVEKQQTPKREPAE